MNARASDPSTEPTYFHQRKADQPFHIDHVFVPIGWAGALTTSVGTYANWVATGHSDHVPVVVDVLETADLASDLGV